MVRMGAKVIHGTPPLSQHLREREKSFLNRALTTSQFGLEQGSTDFVSGVVNIFGFAITQRLLQRPNWTSSGKAATHNLYTNESVFKGSFLDESNTSGCGLRTPGLEPTPGSNNNNHNESWHLLSTDCVPDQVP